MIQYFIDLFNKPQIQYSFIDMIVFLTLIVFAFAVIVVVCVFIDYIYRKIKNINYYYNVIDKQWEKRRKDE